MKCKFSLLLFLCVLPFTGQAQRSPLQELVNKKQFAQVIAESKELTQADSADYATMSAVGQAFEGMVRYKDAYSYYLHCLSMDTLNVDGLNSVARVAMNMGRASVAEDCFLRTLKSDSTNFYASYQLARLYFLQGEYENAAHQYQILCGQDTTFINPTLYSNLGDCYIKMNDPSSAIASYFTAYEVNRENIGLANALIGTLLRVGGTNVPDALDVCDTALYYNPGNRLLTRNKAMALYMSRKYQRADSLYSALMAEGDSSFLTIKYGGAARYMAGQPMDAIELLEEAYRKDSTDVEVNLLLGASLGKTYDRQRAFRLFDQAEMLMLPNEALTNLLLVSRGETLLADNRLHEAEALFYKAWLANKDRLDYLFRIEREYPNHAAYYKTQEQRERGLFIKNLFLKECFLTGKPLKGFHVYRNFLQEMSEDAFFRSVKELTMLSPDGNKSKLSVEDLQALINRLPDMPEDEKAMQAKIDAVMKRNAELTAEKDSATKVAEEAEFQKSFKALKEAQEKEHSKQEKEKI